MYKDERNNMSKVVNKDKKNAKLAKLDYEVITYNEVKNLSLQEDIIKLEFNYQILDIVFLETRSMELEDKENK